MSAFTLFGIAAVDFLTLGLLGLSALAVIIGCVLFLGYPRSDIPALDSPARTGFILVLSSSLIAILAVVLFATLRWWSQRKSRRPSQGLTDQHSIGCSSSL